MEENKTGFLTWVKAHKKQLIFAGISITAIIGIILVNKNKDDIKDLWATLEKSIHKVPKSASVTIPAVSSTVPTHELVAVSRTFTPPQAQFDVSQHMRTMSGGRQHSLEKAAEAAAMGIVLQPNQTLVDSYKKCVAA